MYAPDPSTLCIFPIDEEIENSPTFEEARGAPLAKKEIVEEDSSVLSRIKHLELEETRRFKEMEALIEAQRHTISQLTRNASHLAATIDTLEDNVRSEKRVAGELKAALIDKTNLCEREKALRAEMEEEIFDLKASNNHYAALINKINELPSHTTLEEVKTNPECIPLIAEIARLSE